MRVVQLGSSLFAPPSSPVLPASTSIFDDSKIIAALWSQVLLGTGATLRIVGLELAPTSNAARFLRLDPTHITAMLGQDQFEGWLDAEGEVHSFEDIFGDKRRYACVAMNGHGTVMGVDLHDRTKLYHFPSLSLALSAAVSPDDDYIIRSPTPIDRIVAGANHFLLLTSSSSVYSIGDDRFSQSGGIVPPSTSTSRAPTLNLIEFFSGLFPISITAGDLHSAVITADKSVYIFGKDQEGQCGGGGGGEPSLITLASGEQEEEPEVDQVACGSNHTVLLTSNGDVWVCGLNQAGQLGATTTSVGFSRFDITAVVQLASSERVRKVVCSRWNTFLELDSQ